MSASLEGCRQAGSCDFLHPALANKKTDCDYWVAGKCRYTDNDCRYKHDPTKKGTDKTKRKRSESNGNSPHPSVRKETEVVQPKPSSHPSGRQETVVVQPEPKTQLATQDPDFLLGLVRALTPSLTGEARQGLSSLLPVT